MDLLPLGPIARLHVQQQSLKVGPRGHRAYDPRGIVSVPAVTLDEGGVTGWTADGERVSDVHHADHPLGKFRGDNGVSVLFTPHYAAMRERFGSHITDGIAGESILVETGDMVTLADLRHGLVIQTQEGVQAELCELEVAEPCVEFTRYALRRDPGAGSDASVTEGLRFLRDGMRGYYARCVGTPVRVAVGDRVFLRPL